MELHQACDRNAGWVSIFDDCFLFFAILLTIRVSQLERKLSSSNKSSSNGPVCLDLMIVGTNQVRVAGKKPVLGSRMKVLTKDTTSHELRPSAELRLRNNEAFYHPLL